MVYRTIHHTRKGQSLIELLFAIALFTIGVTTIGYLIIEAHVSIYRNTQFLQAEFLAQEGLEAVRGIRDRDFYLLDEGTYGLMRSEDGWELSEAEETIDAFTRTVDIEEETDDIRMITSTVAFFDILGIEHTRVFRALVTNWRAVRAEAASFVIGADAWTLSATGEILTNIFVQNIGWGDITITEMVLEWDNEETLSELILGGNTIFSAVPGESIASGESIDVTDVVLGAELPPVFFDAFVFSGDMSGTTVRITFILGDGGSRGITLAP